MKDKKQTLITNNYFSHGFPLTKSAEDKTQIKKQKIETKRILSPHENHEISRKKTRQKISSAEENRKLRKKLLKQSLWF